MNGTRNWCTFVDVHPEGQAAGSVDILRLTLQHELTGEELENIAQKAGRKTFAMVSGCSAGHSLASELVESIDGHEEIIKVYLKGRSGDKMIHEKSVNQLKSEVQYIQEARTCLQKLREDISSKLDRDPEDSVHQQELQVTLDCYQREAEQRNVALRREEDRVEQKEAEIRELQRRVLAMEMEHQALLVKVKEGEMALEELQSKKADCLAEQEKSVALEKEVAGLREKIHHLDDMLKSQQRKVRQMIEQLQNSKAVIQSKDATIQELKEKVAYLEAENLEMHDRMEHLIEKQISHGNFSTQTWTKTENLGSVRIAKPPSPKPMPLIRVVET
nr:tuftelin isoform X4 [Cavia porcellus]